MNDFGPAWAQQKLDMPRRRRELERYIHKYLPELRTMEPGLVLDIGCGPGDFLALCREMGHEVLGVDAPNGRGGMGDAYQELAARHRRELGVAALLKGLMGFLAGEDVGAGQCVAINCRGAIEQALGRCLVGPSHELHHNCRALDWRREGGELDMLPLWANRLMERSALMLRNGGILLVAANGTKSTDGWYDATVRKAAEWAGLELVHQEGLLLHKWRKDRDVDGAVQGN